MNPSDDNRDERQIEAFLAAADREAVPPDRPFLQRLRDQSTELFLASARQGQPRMKGRLMTAHRVLAASVAAVLLLGAGLVWWNWQRDANPTFGQVLDNVAHVQTLHCQVTRDGKTCEVWAEQNGRLRRDDPEGTYQIADSGKLWRVDEKANRAVSGPSPYHRDAGEPRLDLLALLDLPGDVDRERLLSEHPVGEVEHEGRNCLVYRAETPAAEGTLEIEALVDRRTRLLVSVLARAPRGGAKKPVAELNVLAYNQAAPPGTFTVRDTLTEDGRVGKIADLQGVVAVKPVMHQRWTPVTTNVLVKPGDWLRTGVRGANAATVRLVKRTRLILGPGTLVEVIKPDQVRLLEGQIEATVPDGDKLELLGPDRQTLALKGTQMVRLDKEKLVHVGQEPRWLRAYKGKTSDESIGSLVALVDGRNVPLTVGEHKVTVDVRDQIARTMIEETFVNHTPGVLEGVFHFPLPAGASISGFAMWIGDKMVEADVVEKQRAREIYEIILHEKRDPGLLEWTGGNIFKARVYPIFGHSEKRIRITYTQVLPLVGGRYRYSYALQSELLQQHPLRDLGIDVKVNSAMPLKAVHCPTHPTRVDKTAHSAHVEFSAREYVPARDFEVVIEPDGRQADVVVIPHRRGSDGYFMMQLTPPGGAAEDREVLPDGGPLHLLILADTSASMDVSQRSAQAAFVAALLSALTPKDTVNLAACDVDCDWVFDRAMPAEPGRLTAAQQFLYRRMSLGWTDLDRAFASVLERCGPKTHVVYVGDGIVTAHDGDATAFVKRLRHLWETKGKGGTFHAVAPGSAYEAGVLQAMASLGGGSVRHIGGEQGPAAVALDLLGEITRPAVRDLKVEFRGLRTASVYPEVLPNLPAGTQQILLGRYLPEGKDQAGEVIVTGTQGDRPVRFSARVALLDAEKGNSFIPRLWARMHLDHLLAQGSTPAIRDEIIALSEEYNIITPYTSLLVLESDADRERFKVKQRFRMRDGEKFFAQGRDNANYELKQQQMKRAGDWRIGLRRQIMRQLAALGRDPRRFLSAERDVLQRLASITDGTSNTILFSERDLALRLGELRENQVVIGRSAGVPLGGPADSTGDLKNLDWGWDGGLPLSAAEPAEAKREADESGARGPELDDRLMGEPADPLESGERDMEGKPLDGQTYLSPEEPPPLWGGEWSGKARMGGLGVGGGMMGMMGMGGMGGIAGMGGMGGMGGMMGTYSRGGMMGMYGMAGVQQAQGLLALYPNLPREAAGPKTQKSTWPAAARTLAQSLLRKDKLARLKGGLDIVQQSDFFDVPWGDLTSRSRKRDLLSAAAWLNRSEADGQATLIRWCDGRQRGVMSLAFQLGRVRAATPQDLGTPPLDLGDYSLSALDRAYGQWLATVEPRKDGETLLILRHPDDPRNEVRILVDTARHVIVRIDHRQDGKTTQVTKFEDFVEAAGCWWARRIETTDAKGRLSARVTLTVKELPAGDLDKEMKSELSARDTVQFLNLPYKSVAAAKRAVAGGKPSFDDHFALLLHYAAIQQWTRAAEQLRHCEQSAAGKPGMRFLHDQFLLISRRHEELKKRLLDEAQRLTKSAPAADGMALAEHLRTRAAQVLEANEMLALVDHLKPICDRQPAHRQGAKSWLQWRLSALQQTGQVEETLRVQKQLATDYSHDIRLQEQYAQALANNGDYPAAYAWLERALKPAVRWQPGEEESLRNLYASFLEAQGRYKELADYLAAWVKQNPENSSPYPQYLNALIRTDRLEQANALIAQWLREGQAPAPAPAAVARLHAAIAQALGSGHNLRTNRIEERWLAPLAEAALALARQEERTPTANMILSAWQFQQTDAGRGVRKTLISQLADQIEKLSPAHVLSYLQWISFGDASVTPDVWEKIADGLHQRWSAETDPGRKHLLGRALVQIHTQQNRATALIAFLHEQWQKGPEPYRTAYAGELFEALLRQPWSAEQEDEVLSLLDKLSDAEAPADRLLVQVAALHRLTDRMIEARRAARMKAVEHPEKLTRTELAKKAAECLKLARTGFADRLRAAVPLGSRDLQPWLKAEWLYLDTRLDRDLPKVAAECWAFLGERPARTEDTAEERDVARQLDEILRDRHLLTLMNLAARKGADPSLSVRLLQYIDRGIAQEEDEFHWKQRKYWLLIALDRTKDLEKTLGEWVQGGDAGNRWQLALGYVLAEQGRIAEAIKLFEAVEASGELGPAAYRALSDWYMTVNRREQHDRARVAMFRMMDEWRIQRTLSIKLYPWQRDGSPPTEVDRDTLLMFAALFEKGSDPRNHLALLQQYYQYTRDFRLLTGLADAVVGHTAAGAYPFLGGMRSLLAEVGDEATVDELAAYLEKVRARAKTAVDRRALDLLEMQVRRRAAELKNQPGPHAEAALAALKRAFKEEWSPGEPRLMADLLAGLGRITPDALAREQLHELEILHTAQAKGTFDRLHIALRLAETRAAYGHSDQAIPLLRAALDEYQEASGGVLPPQANDALTTLVSFYENDRQHDRGEKVLLDQLRHPAHQQQRLWLTLSLYQLYHHAVSTDGTVSLGRGLKLYQAVERKLRADLDTSDHNHRQQLISLLCSFYVTADGKKLTGVRDDLKAFALQRLPEVLRRQTSNYQQIVNQVGHTIHNLLGPRDGFEFLLTQIEREPAWFRLNNQDGWVQFGWTMAQWRNEAKGIGDLDKRLLPVVLAELRRDLESSQQRNRVLYTRQNTFYWTAKEADFAGVAEAVLAKRKQSGPAVQYIAEYFYHGLGRTGRAIEVLADAHKAKLLDEGGQSQLVNYLQWQGRYGESIPLLQPLVKRRPENLSYRVWLMSAYHHTKRGADLLALLKETDAFFHEKDRWTEDVMATLGASCLDNQLYTQAAAYYQEAIPLHQRSHPHRGIGDGTLSSYYGQLARAWSGLGKTAEAVEAASGAIVSWGPTHTNRAQALEALRQVLREAPDLDGYVAALNQKVAVSGLDSPVIRKALGQVYLEKNAAAKAIPQLQLAVTLQPNDPETHRLLIEGHDKQGDKQDAIEAVLQAVQASPRDIKLFQDLGRRLSAQPKEEERAYTSIVEALPSESESHALLAEVRQGQGRWAEAIRQWEHVARIRALEPTGLLKLAAAQVHEGRWEQAAQTVGKLKARTWPARFPNVGDEVRKLEEQIKARKTAPGAGTE